MRQGHPSTKMLGKSGGMRKDAERLAREIGRRQESMKTWKSREEKHLKRRK